MKFITKATIAAVIAGTGVILARNAMATMVTDEDLIKDAEALMLEIHNKQSDMNKIMAKPCVYEETKVKYIEEQQSIQGQCDELQDILSKIKDNSDSKHVNRIKMWATRNKNIARYNQTIMENRKNIQIKKQA